jgi:hypothetical protein
LGRDRVSPRPSERLREGRLPADGLSLVAIDHGRLVGTVRLWNVCAGPGRPALLLGPLAVIRRIATAASAHVDAPRHRARAAAPAIAGSFWSATRSIMAASAFPRR